MLSIAKRKVPNVDVIEMSLYDINKLEEKYDGISTTFTFVYIPKEKIYDY